MILARFREQDFRSSPSPGQEERRAVTIHELYRQSRRAAAWGIVASLTLGLVKLAGSLLGHSVALLSDAIHSQGDALTSPVVFAPLLWSQQPADREHPY